MRSFLRFTYLPIFLSLLFSVGVSNAQLLYEGMVFDGMEKPMLDNASSVSISPNGNHVYVTSFDDNAVTVYSRDESGSLTFIESKKNEVDNITGMNGAYHLKISPDGNHVYVAGSEDSAIAIFSRNTIDGTLTYVNTYWNNVDGVRGLAGISSIDIPADGNNIYVTGPDNNTVAVFKRNVLDGSLTFVQVLEDGDGDIADMNFPWSLKVSPNGKHVYVTSFGDNALNVFSRNSTTGELTFVESHKDGVAGVFGLLAAYSPYVSPDGLQVYVSGLDSDAVVAFNRDPQSGELTYIDTYVDGTNGVDGIAGATEMKLSPDGNHLYVAGSNEDAVGIFSRNADSGELMFLSVIQDGVNGVSGMSYPTYLDLSEDGRSMYVSGFASASVAVFRLDNSSGGATFSNAETDAGLGVSGLDGSNAVAVSPNGDHVYVAGNNDDAIVVFERDEETGLLNYIQDIEDASATDGLNGINGLVVSTDGRHVYTTSFWDKAIVAFERNVTTGMLTYIERYKDGISGVDGLNGVNSIATSPDGNTIYVTAFWEHSVAVFSRDVVDGTLNFEEVFKDGSSGVDGLNRASGVTVSPDGNNVYVAGYNDDAIAHFDRAMDGTLTYVTVLKDGTDGVDGINRVNGIVVSPDNAHVYATGLNDDAIAIFSRDLATGTLTYESQVKDNIDGVEGMDGPSRLAVSPNGERIYATSTNDDAIVALRRNPADGSLIFENAIYDTDEGINGLDGAQFVAISPDSRHMYTAGAIDDAVAVFSCTYVFSNLETICEGDSVVVGSVAYHEPGIYVDTFSFGACKSVSTLELIVQPAMTTIDVEICGGDVYEYNGETYNATGNHAINFTSGMGCDSTVMLNIEVVSAFTEEVIVASICEGETHTLGYSSTGIYTNMYTTAFGCDSVVILDLTVSPVYEISLDAEICEGEFYVLGTQNYISSGTFVETFTSANGCDSTITLNLNVVEPETIMNETICAGEVFTIDGNTFTEEGTYNFVVSSTAGCDSDVTLNLNVNSAPMMNQNVEICEGDSYTVGNETYTESGDYTVVLQAASGCDSTIMLDLVVHATTVDVAATICEGDSYTVGTSTFSTTGFYPVVLTSLNGCGDSTVNLTLTVDPSEIMLPATICDGEVYTLGDTDYTMTGVYTQTIVSAAGCETEYTLDLTVNEVYNASLVVNVCAGGSIVVGTETYTESGIYENLLTSSTGCDSIVNLQLTVLEPVEAVETIVDANGSIGGSIDLEVSGGLAPYTFNWSNGMTTEDVSGLTPGAYSVEVTDANGCVANYDYQVDQTNSTFEVGANIDLTIYPNPARAGGKVNLSFNINSQQRLKIQLFDNVGKLVSTEMKDFLSGNTVHTMDLPNVQGLYQLLIETEQGDYKTIQLAVK